MASDKLPAHVKRLEVHYCTKRISQGILCDEIAHFVIKGKVTGKFNYYCEDHGESYIATMDNGEANEVNQKSHVTAVTACTHCGHSFATLYGYRFEGRVFCGNSCAAQWQDARVRQRSAFSTRF